MKKNAIFALLVCATLAAGGLDVADLKNRTLPADVYAKLGKGAGAPLFWKDAKADLSQGWTLEGVEYKAEELNSGLLEVLKKQAGALARPKAPIRATFRVVQNHKSGFLDRVKFTLEGVFVDQAGKVVAAFADEGSYIESHRNPGKAAGPELDALFSRLLKDLK